jgi:hypothetical protein
MGAKTLTNVRCLEDLIGRAPLSCLQSFTQISECQPAFRDFSWPTEDSEIRPALLDALRRAKKEPIAAAEREAWRIDRLSSPRGAQVLMAAAEQLNDKELFDDFAAQPGGEHARAIWMRSHGVATRRIFEIAESILNTGDKRGGKKLYDAYEIPSETAPPFLWTEKIKGALEAQLAKAMKLDAPPEVVHLELVDEIEPGRKVKVHYLVIRFAGNQVGAVKVEGGRRESFWYYPARDATLVYSPDQGCVEAFAHNLALRAPMANVLATHGFKVPLSHRPLNRARYDLSPFTQPLKHLRPALDAGKVERIYLTEAKALLGHGNDKVTLEMSSGAELHEVIAARWGNHPFVASNMLLKVTLSADIVFDGETHETPITITVAKPGRCSLHSERDSRTRIAGEQLLEHLGVRRRLRPGLMEPTPPFLVGVCSLLEQAGTQFHGFALRDMGVDIEAFANEGILIEGERITSMEIESTPDAAFEVELERCADGKHVRYADPSTGLDQFEPAHLARRWSLDRKWLREELLTALGSQLIGARSVHLNDDPVFLGEIKIDSRGVGVYFAARMGSERCHRHVDLALRQQARSVPGIVLTTSPQPLPFAGMNVVIPIQDVLGQGDGRPTIDHDLLAMLYRNQEHTARGGAKVDLVASVEGYSATLTIPGKAAWPITGRMKIVVLDRLVKAHYSGPSHLQTAVLLKDASCDSLDGLFGKGSLWREYIEKVPGTRGWRLRLGPRDSPGSAEHDTDESADSASKMRP